MIIRQATENETEVGSSVIYQKNPDNCSSNAPSVIVKGFLPYQDGDSDKEYLFIIETFDKQIILATNKQLFIQTD